ncbi:hypothetical protein, partial [Acetomicrobium sp. S15 = DSM 107314]|uniref:hypothetical protein n=1 Tax=Acetomicrobium sp. S15 = DSM 107314 TaxID=2529858 RepID=UPI001E4A5561
MDPISCAAGIATIDVYKEENLICIQEDLIQKTYSVGKFNEFFVYDPKMRLIMALPFRDRVVQWAIY